MNLFDTITLTLIVLLILATQLRYLSHLKKNKSVLLDPNVRIKYVCDKMGIPTSVLNSIPEENQFMVLSLHDYLSIYCKTPLDARVWLKTPLKFLNGVTPLDHMNMYAYGIQDVINYVKYNSVKY